MPGNARKKQQRKNKNRSHQKAAGEHEDENDENAGKNSVSEATVAENDNNSNKPYSIKQSELVGRYLVASRKLNAGEKIIEVAPLAIGPWAESDPICLGCHRLFEKGSKILRCVDCNWRICSENCQDLAVHRNQECIPLKEHNVAELLKTATPLESKFMYEAIFALRCLLLKKTDSEKFNLLLKMDSLNELRRTRTLLWTRNQREIVERIRNLWKFDEFSEDEIHTVCGIIEVNSFQIGQHDVHTRALYPEAFYLMHDCTPNTTHTDDPISHVLTIRLTKDLMEGETITLSYAYTLQGTLKRRQHLFDCKFFWCQCKRCSDPTEFGTNCSSLKCSKCSKGLVISTNPLDQDASWKCNHCSYEISATVIVQLLDRLFTELDGIDANSIELYEQFISKYRSTLHENHYLILSAEHSLCSLYGKIDGYLMSDLTIEQIKRKETICRHLLALVEDIEPGLSRLRGVIMYELHAPIMIEAKYRFETKQLNMSQVKRSLDEALKLLKLSARILSFEPPGSPEHEMALAASDAVSKMQS
ncbi:SET domain-containing protein SmydA-8-like [Uranotaenia lowii]|uniref:SET domain-containing protein SmydA-8-like n=1 Tax=Uranotaenia lowii TaxID=190385 RepID=UPI0024789D96|nr:SET domain-containing protein SmydA-8-like [Uranotaenia lowii]XP_055598202.1 SET domain-containing protein SmydA-8-like [Uranotaenia lowii]XP_055598203.1 SET domain-containing protein SmydA-8-like [Uranotaenia lowii]